MPAAQLWSGEDSPPGPDNPRSIAAVRIEGGESIRLDGILDEAVWLEATPAADFLQQDPDEGEPATERTEVFVVYDRDNLYLGVMLYDSDPDGIIAYQKQRDARINTDDRFMWILDTFLDGRTGYFFETNPMGIMSDGLLDPGAMPFFPVNKSWDGIWEARSTKGTYGWSTEVRIPFRTLNFDPSRDSWGINFSRVVVRKNEESLWNGHRRNQGIFEPVHAGRLTGLRGMSQGRGLETKPYVASGWRNMPEEADPTSFPADVGFDLTYSVTPGLRAAFTVNTDFAEVEVDERLVNLTRFPLFYPEQRDFFLEGSGVFGFSGSFGWDPYFSRRIGLAELEEEREAIPIPITYGARLAGQAGRYELGFIQVRTDQHRTLPAEDFTVARVKRSLFRQSFIGVIYTRRATDDMADIATPPDRHMGGIDLDLSTSQFLGDKNLMFQANLVWHTDPVKNGVSSFRNLSSHAVVLGYPNDIWSSFVSYREFGEKFDPAVGFIGRTGYREVGPRIEFRPRPQNIKAIRQFSFEFDLEYMTDLSNRLLAREIDLEFFGIWFESGDNVALGVMQQFERLDYDFEIHDSGSNGPIVIPVGEYDTRNWYLRGRSAGRRPIACDIEMNVGQFWSGHRSGVELELMYRPYPGISLGCDVERNDVRLREGDFSTNLFRLSSEWHASPWVSVTGNIQYDDVTEIMGLYAKFRWIVRPGSDLYLVYTHNWLNINEEPLRFNLATLSRGATTKINYTFRF
ncbi:MAG: carbohydrate binding family 9 domain-containing protein [Fidelibacterota bacterium]|nr:MAG: carbohydrate binding family 9 domain-containing protein [Candidatus Neomarinimicrobiota bacterium]